ncbi:MAG TPA: GTPase [Pseudonocardiaceae bacterium]
MNVPPWLGPYDAITEACVRHRRQDLADRLVRRRSRLLDPALRVAVVGGPNQGKSQLVNALVNAPVCAVTDDLSAPVTTVVRHAEQPSAVLVRPGGRVPVPIDRLAEHGPGDAEVGIPRKLLAGGLVLVDTPAGTAPDDADLLLLVSAADTPLTAAELELVRGDADVLVALTRIDLVPRWREVAARCRETLLAAGLPGTVLPVSAALRLHAAGTDDHALNAESGFADLVERLRTTAAGKATTLAPRRAALTAHAVAEELVHDLHAQLAAATDEGATARWTLEEVRRGAARCQTLLADEMADLASDLDHDLRDRARRILVEIDTVFETADPARTWAEFEDWLHDELTEAADANFSWLLQRCRWIADRVAAEFPHLPPAAEPPDAGEWTYAGVGELRRPRLEPFTLSQKAFTGLRGSYGGVLMLGLVTSLTVGLPLFNPISLGAGVLFGGKSIHEEGEQRLRRRQGTARAAAQRHVDDFFLRYGKDTRDTARHIHRGLRDHFGDVATELQERLGAVARAGAARHAQRQAELRRELDSLRAVHARLAGRREIPA